MKPRSFSMVGRRYRIRWVPNLTGASHHENDRVIGTTDEPKKKGKEVLIQMGLSPFEEMESIIHEALHAGNWHLSEEWVSEAAEDITRLLRRCGFRRQDEHD